MLTLPLFEAVGHIESPFDTKNGTPRQPQLIHSAQCRMKLRHPRLPHPEHALEGLSDYSHVWLLFYFHQDASLAHPNEQLKSKVRLPKLAAQKCGLFATRSPQRPNAIGLSLVELEKVEIDTLHLRGADLVDGTPILDVKPYLPHVDGPRVFRQEPDIAVSTTTPTWLTTSIRDEEPLRVFFSPRAEAMLYAIFNNARANTFHYHCAESFRNLVAEVLAGDPRSVYRKDKCSDRLYFLELDGLHVTAWFDNDGQGNELAEVLRIRTKGCGGRRPIT